MYVFRVRYVNEVDVCDVDEADKNGVHVLCDVVGIDILYVEGVCIKLW